MATLTEKYGPYPGYKPSGADWLGDVPAHWEVKRLKYSAPLRNDKLGNKPEDVAYVGLENIEPWTGKLLLDYQPDSVDSTVVTFAPGDVLFGKLRPYLAKVAHPDFEGTATSEVLVMRPLEDCSQSYLAYCLLNAPYIRWIDTLTYGAKMPRVSPDEVACSFIPLPPLPEQQAIAAFLDRETARIDALVSKKERLMELLQEKRTALITRAVTRGLDPDASVKDSGVEWLGEIPAHWEVKRLKHLAGKVGSGKTPKGGAERYVDDGVMLLRSQNVHFGELRLADVAYIDTDTDEEMAGSRVLEGDVLLNITGASLGRSCVARLRGKDANVNQHVCILRPNQQQDEPEFLAYSVESRSLQDQIFNNENGVSRDALNFEQIGDLVFARPAKNEQLAIAAFLDQETGKLDSLIAKIREAIERLRELRSALISAAVTGRIDVREEAECQ